MCHWRILYLCVTFNHDRMVDKTISTVPGYCNSLVTYSRFQTCEVAIGNVPMGGNNPIRIQSMTTTDTMDTMATVEQTIRMVEAGCEYVRITAPSVKEALNLSNIKSELRLRGYDVPLIADIHFTPNAAEAAARIVEKVRINPGNYADRKKFDQLEYTHSEYEAELERIYNKFSPLVKVCKEYGTAMRIGTNHGSLSDRIMSYYGDTPRGMVESAMEFIRMCESLNYYSLVVSMKSSNPQVMVQAYRLLVQVMKAENMRYPLHLGVTEAGDGEDGRIKSAVGIGTLLEDGLGDTIRVSLTEDPEQEAPVAIALASRYSERAASKQPFTEQMHAIHSVSGYTPYEFQKRESRETASIIGGSQVPRVIVDLSMLELKDPGVLSSVGYKYSYLLDKYDMSEQSVDFVYFGKELPSFTMPGNLKQIYNYQAWLNLTQRNNCHPLLTLSEYYAGQQKDTRLNFLRVVNEDLDDRLTKVCISDPTLVLILSTSSVHGMADQRQFFFKLLNNGVQVPVIIQRTYTSINTRYDPVSTFQLAAATDTGALLIDGFGDGIWLRANNITPSDITSTSFAILQATRSRISKTEYISCPSCGRTLFDLQETTQMIRSRTSHLKGLKIGIMGCIVNGPGEMADADYGYVGTGPDKITLYRGKEVVKKNVSSAQALDELITIIQADGNWVES